MKLRIKRFDTNLPLPVAKEGAAGFDLSCRTSVTINPHEIGIVPVNLAVQVPAGYLLLIASRSSTPLKKGLLLANGIGIIDPFFCGDDDEMIVQLLNYTDKPVNVQKGELLTQAVLIKHQPVELQELTSFDSASYGGYWAAHTTMKS